jgi:hypothetical protein
MMRGMRTTITLDPEAEALVKQVMAERKLSFKEVVNDAIIRGLRPSPRREIDLPTYHMGPPLVDLDKSTQLAGELDDEEFVRKMLLGQ